MKMPPWRANCSWSVVVAHFMAPMMMKCGRRRSRVLDESTFSHPHESFVDLCQSSVARWNVPSSGRGEGPFSHPTSLRGRDRLIPPPLARVRAEGRDKGDDTLT